MTKQYVCTTAGCGAISPNRKCDACRVRRKPREARNNEAIRRRYRTSRWERLRKRVLERDNHLCQACARSGIVRTGNEIDHIKKAMDNLQLFWTEENLETLCKRCHSKKTQRGD